MATLSTEVSGSTCCRMDPKLRFLDKCTDCILISGHDVMSTADLPCLCWSTVVGSGLVVVAWIHLLHLGLF